MSSFKIPRTASVPGLPIAEEDLLKVVQEAIKKDIVDRCAMNEKQSILQRVKLLTPREYEILTYVISGRLNKQTA